MAYLQLVFEDSRQGQCSLCSRLRCLLKLLCRSSRGAAGPASDWSGTRMLAASLKSLQKLCAGLGRHCKRRAGDLAVAGRPRQWSEGPATTEGVPSSQGLLRGGMLCVQGTPAQQQMGAAIQLHTFAQGAVAARMQRNTACMMWPCVHNSHKISC